MKRDLNEIAKIEKAIAAKYGKEAVCNPKSGWDTEKEKKHKEDLIKFYERKKEKKEKNINNEHLRTCPVCKIYSLKEVDDLYMNKFQCCFDCFIKYIEDREERWHSGWRPQE